MELSCPDCSWYTRNQTSNPDGILDSLATSLLDCQNECLATQSACAYGFDWHADALDGQQCWISTSWTSNPANVFTAHYQLSCNTGMSFTLVDVAGPPTATNSDHTNLQDDLFTASHVRKYNPSVSEIFWVVIWVVVAVLFLGWNCWIFVVSPIFGTPGMNGLNLKGFETKYFIEFKSVRSGDVFRWSYRLLWRHHHCSGSHKLGVHRQSTASKCLRRNLLLESKIRDLWAEPPTTNYKQNHFKQYYWLLFHYWLVYRYCIATGYCIVTGYCFTTG